MLRFQTVPFLSFERFSRNQAIVCFTPAGQLIGWARPWLEASAGIPCAAPARAAPTVPERPTKGPTFAPSLIPDMTRSGFFAPVVTLASA
jgi:hypothetical protein